VCSQFHGGAIAAQARCARCALYPLGYYSMSQGTARAVPVDGRIASGVVVANKAETDSLTRNSTSGAAFAEGG
jgi:hypothetical protein